MESSESISSMKITHGDRRAASVKIARVFCSLSPTYLLKIVDVAIDRKFAPLSRASAFASIVLPVPGGPNSSRPLHDFSSDDCAKISGRRSGRMIVSYA